MTKVTIDRDFLERIGELMHIIAHRQDDYGVEAEYLGSLLTKAIAQPAQQGEAVEGVVVSRELLENCADYMMGSASARVRIWHDQCRALLASAGVMQARSAQPVSVVPDGLPMLISGAVFDFAGYLTTRDKVIEVGATANASPIADLVKEWAEFRGLSIVDAAVLSWQYMLAAAPARAERQVGQESEPAPKQHPDDAAVDRFAAAMKAKLARSREKGRHGWQNCTAPHLSAMLYDHLYKADPLDVGNFAMMLHQNGQAIELPFEARGRHTTPQPAPAQDVAGWIPVTERLPEVAQEVIVSTEFEGVCAGFLDSYGEWFAPCSEYKLTRVTHWMSLPPAPEMVNPDGPK